MKLLIKTRTILFCLEDVRRARQRLAKAWRMVRRDGGVMERGMRASMLREAQRWLTRVEATLVLAWECCVRRDEVAATVATAETGVS